MGTAAQPTLAAWLRNSEEGICPIVFSLTPGKLRAIPRMETNERFLMKALFLCFIAMGLVMAFAGCEDDRSSTRTGGTVNTNNTGGSTNTLTPSSIQNKTLVAQVANGSTPLSSTGSFVVTPIGSTSGSFTSSGMGANVGNTSGNFSFVPAPNNEATMVLNDQSLGTVTLILTFQSNTAGTFTSTSSLGGSQTGTFVLQ
jgi:hypothetical protein